MSTCCRLLVLLAILCMPLSASALTIELTNVVVSLNAGNTADGTNGGRNGGLTVINTLDGAGGGQNPQGDTGTITTGGIDTDAQVSDTLSASTRLASGNWRTSNTDRFRTLTNDYQITFDVNADVGIEYDIAITHDLEGVIESAGGGNANNTNVTDVIATIISDGGGLVSGDLTQLTALTAGGIGEFDINVAPAVITISGLSGDQTITLDFAWTSNAYGGTGTDGATRFGVDPYGNQVDVVMYGFPDVDGPGDGHFVGITSTVTLIPEPGTASLLALGLLGLALHGRRRAL